MPMYDFSCSPCKLVFDDMSTSTAEGVAPVPCPSCGAVASQVWLTAPGVHADGNISAQERTAAILKYRVDPVSRHELNTLRRERGEISVGKNALLDEKHDAPKFKFSEEQRGQAVEMVRRNRAKGASDEWRAGYTKDPEIIKAAETAAKELAK